MASIDILAPFILSWEGLYSNRKNDKGGPTMRGVTIATWRQVGYDKDGDGDIDVDDLKLVTEDDAVNRVMKPHYWDRWKADQIESQSLANTLVDWVWCSGVNGIKKPQELLGVTADGIVGPKTLAALNSVDPKTFFAKVQARREKFLRAIVQKDATQKENLKGWLRRLSYIQYGSLQHNSTKTDIHTFTP